MKNRKDTPAPDVAYYYPAPYWLASESDWIKSLLLFFDRVAILLPGYMYGQHVMADPILAGPLEERGLLQVLEPNDWVNESMAHQLGEIIVELLTNGGFDDLSREDQFLELSYSRLGHSADFELSDFLVDELRANDLARPSEDGVSVPLHPTVRTTILTLLGQLSRAAGSKRGLVVHPTTQDRGAVEDLISTLSREAMPSRTNVIAFDLEPVGLNLSSIPLDDVVQFRAERRDAHRAYMRDLQRCMAELAAINEPEQREALLLQRREEIAAAAHDIRRTAGRAFGKSLSSWSLGLTGAAWALTTGDLLGAALSAAGLVPKVFGDADSVTAYSYLFAAQEKMGKNYRE
ncbi:MAG: hypothetical protein OXU74_11395 [Gemmatimonadota bacterium]|nr:hypothetical protein [Gemmatimonadota bacterium]